MNFATKHCRNTWCHLTNNHILTVVFLRCLCRIAFYLSPIVAYSIIVAVDL